MGILPLLHELKQGFLTSLNFGFLIYKVGVIIFTL